MWHWQINGQSEPGEAHGRVGARGGKLWCVQVEKGEEAKARAAMAARTVSAADARVQSIDGCGCLWQRHRQLGREVKEESELSASSTIWIATVLSRANGPSRRAASSSFTNIKVLVIA